LRAVAGQLILAKRARQIERTIIRRTTRELDGLHADPSCADLGRLSPAELRDLGLGARRGAALVRLCRSLELEKLKAQPTALLAGLRSSDWADIVATSRREERAAELREKHGVEATTDNTAAIKGADVVVLAVKPQDIETLLGEVGHLLKPEQTVLSVAAAIPT